DDGAQSSAAGVEELTPTVESLASPPLNAEPQAAVTAQSGDLRRTDKLAVNEEAPKQEVPDQPSVIAAEKVGGDAQRGADSAELAPAVEQPVPPQLDARYWVGGTGELGDLHSMGEHAHDHGVRQDESPAEPSARAANKKDEDVQSSPDRVEPAPAVEKPAPGPLHPRFWVGGIGAIGNFHTAQQTVQTPSAEANPAPIRHPVPAKAGEGFQVSDEMFVTRLSLVQNCTRVSVGSENTVRPLASDAKNDLVLLSAVSPKAPVASLDEGATADVEVASGEATAPERPERPDTQRSDDVLNDTEEHAYSVAAGKLNTVQTASDVVPREDIAITASALRGFLDGNGAKIKTMAAPGAAGATALAAWATDMTVSVQCWH
ncbi:MAG: hypothetical protein OEM00_11140, partial [Burkholderiaceae bacterium]|nr:hypothetical protein [Burkholderiaceae bacterium]